MGKLLYGMKSMEIDFDDRSLAHLQIVITSKLRRGESFMFSWEDSIGVGDGRSAIWLDPSVPLYFRYVHSSAARINRLWIESLMELANSPTGMRFIQEPDAPETPLPGSHV